MLNIRFHLIDGREVDKCLDSISTYDNINFVEDIELLESEEINKFHQFCMDTFATFYGVQKELVVQESIRSGLSDMIVDFYDDLHTQGPFYIIQEMLDYLQTPMGLETFEDRYRGKYILRLYHGTNENFDVPDLSKCRAACDFGRGLYLTPQEFKARRFASRRGTRTGSSYLYTFEFNTLAAKVLRIKDFKGVNAEWATYLANCRLGLEVDKYDIVIGPVADDEVYNHTQDYLDGRITLEKFIELAKPYENYLQYTFCTAEALVHLKLLKKEAINE